MITVEDIATFVEHLRDDYQSTTEPVGKVARLIREKFGSAPDSLSEASVIAGQERSAQTSPPPAADRLNREGRY